jgi:hypothetical protein
MFFYLRFQAIIYEGQDKNPEMCRVLLTHEIMCRSVQPHFFPAFLKARARDRFENANEFFLSCFSLKQGSNQTFGKTPLGKLGT